MELSFDKDVVKPGEEVTLSVKTEPKSCVAIRSVDKSVELLKETEDLENTVSVIHIHSNSSSTFIAFNLHVK